MQVKVEKTGPCKARVSFSVPADEFSAEVRRMLQGAGARARMKGFRPGHVPPAVIERLHGKEVRREARQHFVQAAYERALGEHELRPLSHPRVDLEAGEPVSGEDFSLDFELTLRPEFQLGSYRELEIEHAPVQVGDADVEQAIEALRRSQAHPEPAGEPGLPADGMALCKVELVHEGQVVWSRDGLRLGARTPPAGVEPQAYEAALVGQRDGQTVELPLAFPADFEVEAARGRTGTCRVTITQAFRIVLPERKDLPALVELADEAALLVRVRERLEAEGVARERARRESELLGRVIDAHALELPAGMVEEQARRRLEELRGELAGQGLPPEELEAELARQAEPARAAAERSAKAFFVIEAIAEAEKLEVAEADLRSELEAIARRNRASFEEVARYYREQELVPQLTLEILERKVRAFLREHARLKSPAG